MRSNVFSRNSESNALPFLLVGCRCNVVKSLRWSGNLQQIQGLLGEEIGIGVEIVVEVVFSVAGCVPFVCCQRRYVK